MLRTACIALLLLALSGCTQGKADGGGDGRNRGPEARRLPVAGARRHRPGQQRDRAGGVHRRAHRRDVLGRHVPPDLAGDDPDDKALGAYVYDRCQSRFQRFLGGDESLVLRSTMTWAWFRPTKEAWAEGAHWFRCDVVGGGEQSKSFTTLPKTAKGLLLGKPDDRWLVCVDGPSVSGSVKIPCSSRHTWRAVTTISVGKGADDYPGDRVVEVRTRDFCSRSVAAWLNYPIDYDYGYTWFHAAEWKAGNRRSICWAKTAQ